MYNNGSEALNDEIEKIGGNALKLRLQFADFALEDVVKCEYVGGSNTSGDITIGTSTMAYVDMAIATDKVINNQEFLLSAGVELADGQIEYIPIGYFTVQTIEEDEEVISFKAYDRMQKFEKAYFSTLNAPTTDVAVVNEICEICGVPLKTTLSNPITLDELPSGYTCREMLGYIAGNRGMFAYVNRYGELEIAWYKNKTEKNISKIWKLTKEQKDYTINKVYVAKDADTTFKCGDGRGIECSNPLATEEITKNIYNELAGFAYRPCTVTMLDDVRLEPIDIIQIVYLDGTTLLVPAMEIRHNFTAGYTTLSAFGKSETETEYSYSGPLTTAIERTTAELLVVNKVVSTKVDAEWVKANTVTADKINSVEAEINKIIANMLTVGEADIRYANIALTNIDTANINKATIGTILAEVGLITNATIVDGHVTGYLDSVSINANSITAGTLSVDRLVIRGSEQSIVYEINNMTGALQAVQGDTLNGEILTERSITADRIVTKTITASEIASGTITVNELNVNDIFGNSAVLQTMTSAEAFINAINTNSVVVSANSNAAAALSTANAAKKQIYHTASAGSGKSGYFKLAQIKIEKAYQNQPIKISVVNRNGIPSTAWITFANSANADAGLSRFAKAGTTKFYMHKVQTSTWDLYVQKSEAYDSLSVTEYEKGAYMSGTTLTWADEYIGGLPAGVTEAQQTVATAEWCYNNDITYIDGGNIYAGTVTAEKINTATLSAITANLGTVTAGIIQSTNYVSGANGMRLDLASGIWDSKNFKIASDGSVSASNLVINTQNGDLSTDYIRFDKGGYYTAIGVYRIDLKSLAGTMRIMPSQITMSLNDDEVTTTKISPGNISISERMSAGKVLTTSGADLDTIDANTTWRTATVSVESTYASWSGSYSAKYRYDANVLEICVRGTMVTRGTVAEGQALCKISGLAVAIPSDCATMVWDDTAQVWRRVTLGTDGYIRLSSNASIPASSWLSSTTLNFVIFRI